MRIRLFIFFLVSIFCLHSCSLKNEPEQIEEASIKLGHYLFFDNRLSGNHTKSCASCHSPNMAFTDGYRSSVTPFGENVLHNAPSLLNINQYRYFDWANPSANSIAKQIKRPLYARHPIELGLDQHVEDIQQLFSADSIYADLFRRSFPKDKQLYTLAQIEYCIVLYEMQLQSRQSLFDQHKLDESAQRGEALFRDTRLHCIQCHQLPDFTLASLTTSVDSVYANIGLYNVANSNAYPIQDAGLILSTKQSQDNGKFKIPSLRNVAITSPYMHDGSVASLAEVIDMYASGGRTIMMGPFKGDGRKNSYKHPLIQGFEISNDEKKDLIHFLESLTDTSYLKNPLFLDPWPRK